MLSPKHAAAFANGMEYFNTYGGCTAAGAAGSAVLKVLQGERLQQHAHRVGQHLLAKLEFLKQVRKIAVSWLCCSGCEGCNRLKAYLTCFSYEEQVLSNQQLVHHMSIA